MDARKELAHIQKKGYDFYQEQFGEGVLWYEYDGQGTNYGDNVFNEGGRTYKEPIGITALWATITEDDEHNSHEGRRVTPTLRMAFSMQSLRRSGMSDPGDAVRHLNDLVLYGREFFAVGAYEIHGRLNRQDVIVGVNAIKRFPDEDMVFDTIPDFDGFDGTIKPFGRGGNDMFEWPFHERPAAQPDTP